MKAKEKVKFVKDVATENTDLAARKPFRVDREN